MDVTDSIALRMEYYQELEHATRMLNHPGDALVLQTDFLLMVERVDVCIEYFQDHVSSGLPIGCLEFILAPSASDTLQMRRCIYSDSSSAWCAR